MLNVSLLRSTAAVGFTSLLFALGCGGGSSSDANGGGTGAGARAGSGATNGSGADAGDDGEAGSGSTGSGNTGSGGTSGGSGATAGSGSTASGGTTAIDLGVCSNGLDDDGDGFVDGFDPECTGAIDDDEGTFSTGIPGDNRDPKWQDCFFDGNSGAGDDQCRYATECLTGEYDADHEDCELSQACIDFCKPLTPNGCDCFGCCTLQGPDGETADVALTAACSIDNLDDEQACPRCEKSTDCGNTCGRCELCPGKTDLPADCTPSTGGSGGMGGTGGTSGSSGNGGTGGIYEPPPGHTCDGGEQVCSASSPCPSSYYCQLGCCIVVIR